MGRPGPSIYQVQSDPTDRFGNDVSAVETSLQLSLSIFEDGLLRSIPSRWKVGIGVTGAVRL